MTRSASLLRRLSASLLLVSVAACDTSAAQGSVDYGYNLTTSDFYQSHVLPTHDAIDALRAEDDRIVFRDGYKLFAGSVDGPPATETKEVTASGSVVTAATSDAESFFVAVGQKIWRRSVHGESWSVMYETKLGRIDALDVDDRYVYITEPVRNGAPGAHRLLRQARAASASESAEVLAELTTEHDQSEVGILALAHDEAFVYFACELGIFRTSAEPPLGGVLTAANAPKQLSPLVAGSRIEVAEDKLYVISDARLRTLSLPSGGEPADVFAPGERDFDAIDFALAGDTVFVSAR
jgi:hypothetical protein